MKHLYTALGVLIVSWAYSYFIAWLYSKGAFPIRLDTHLIAVDAVFITVCAMHVYHFDKNMGFHGDLIDIGFIVLIFLAFYFIPNRWKVKEE